MDDNLSSFGTGEWQGYPQKTIQDVLFEEINRVMIAASREHREGFTRQVMNGQTITEVYEPSTEESFCNSVDALECFLAPHMNKTEEKEKEKIESEKESLAKTCKEEAGEDWREVFITNYKYLSWKKLSLLCRTLKRLGYDFKIKSVVDFV